MHRRLRIAFVTYAMHCGGMETFILRLGKFLRQEGCEVELVTTIEPGEWFGRLAELNIRAHHVGGYSPSGPLTPYEHSLRVIAQLTAGEYDLIFLNHAKHAQAMLARLPESVVAIPILHNDAEEIYRVGCGSPDAWNAGVAVSPKVAASARPRLPRRPMLEIPYGVELPDPDLWQRRQAFSRPLELLFVGRLDHAQKGVLWLPDIYRACIHRGVDARLTIVGDGPDAQALQDSLLRYDLHERTRHLRGLTPEQVYRLLLQSHILLMPSYYEGLPIALLEALACGCVPVVTHLPGITDAAVKDGESGILTPLGDVTGYADAIASLYNDPARWARMSSAAHESACQRFSVDAMGRSYLRLITEAVNGRYPLPLPRKSQHSFDLSVFSWRDFLPDRLRRLGRRGRAWVRSLSPADPRQGHRA